ncbi:MAG: hypothetical protein HYS43_00435 [Candidatus Liptonbacteria bacterium]|nr:hypothetical protein [Candidatus Liptonbacteria bacterium]
MGNALRSISEKIRWSLVLRAAVVALAWLVAPTPVFLGAGGYFYFSPLFQPFKFIWSFAAFLVLGALFASVEGPAHLILGVAFGAVFFLILGVKDFVFVNRVPALFFIFVPLLAGTVGAFFSRVQPTALGAIGASALTALAIALLLKEFLAAVLPDVAPATTRAAAAILAFLAIQTMWAISFLPLDFINAAALVVTLLVLATEIVILSLRNTLTRKRLILYGATALVLVGGILLAAKWSL